MLIDTNIFLELLLDQQNSAEVESFLTSLTDRTAYISDFSLHSILVHMERRGKWNEAQQFLDDIAETEAFSLIHLSLEETQSVFGAMEKFGLDFDDAYQFRIAEIHGYELVSYDKHFDKTPLKRKTPVDFIP